jgi:hypothetical protein
VIALPYIAGAPGQSRVRSAFLAMMAERRKDLTMFEGCTFEGTRVDLHAGAYVNCTFIRCELVFNGGPLRLDNPTIIGCSWNFQGAAASTMDLLRVLCTNDPNVAHQIAGQLGLIHEHTH